MALSIDGCLSRWPSLRGVAEFEEDTFSLVMKRSVSLGLTWFGQPLPPSLRWDHHEAEGAWDHDDDVARQLGWFQVGVPEPLAGRLLPVQPALSVLLEALGRVGDVNLHGVYAVLPVSAAPDARTELLSMADWHQFGGQRTQRTLGVSVLTELPGDSAHLGRQVAETSNACAVDSTDKHALSFEPGGMARLAKAPPGEGDLLMQYSLARGEPRTERRLLTLQCETFEWSLDVAAWVVNILVEVLRQLGSKELASISVIAL